MEKNLFAAKYFRRKQKSVGGFFPCQYLIQTSFTAEILHQQKDINSTFLLLSFSMSPPKHAQLKPTSKISTNLILNQTMAVQIIPYSSQKTIMLKVLF